MTQAGAHTAAKPISIFLLTLLCLYAILYIPHRGILLQTDYFREEVHYGAMLSRKLLFKT